MNANIDGDIRKAQEQVKIILDNTNTAKVSKYYEMYTTQKGKEIWQST